jgi:hypothetical protein
MRRGSLREFLVVSLLMSRHNPPAFVIKPLQYAGKSGFAVHSGSLAELTENSPNLLSTNLL